MSLVDIGHFDQDGIWISENKKEFASWLSVNKDKKIVIEGKRWSKNRTHSQNSYYWGVVLKLLSDHTGHSQDELHEYLKGKFNQKYIEIKKGQFEPYGGSTVTLGTIDFENYLEEIRRWAAVELGADIPLPNEEKT